MADIETTAPTPAQDRPSLSGRICLIGNSHASALTKALKDDPAPFDPDRFDIYVTNIKTWRAVTVRDGAFVATDSALEKALLRGNGEVRPADYDAFLLCGLGLKYNFALQSLAMCDLFPADGDKPLISRGALKAMLVDMFSASVAGYFLKELPQMTDAPILLIMAPVPGETLVENRWYKHIAWPDAARIVALARTLTEEAIHELCGERVQTLFPDEALLTEQGLTARRYLRGKGGEYKGKLPHDEGFDHIHMNGDYGRHVLEQAGMILSALQETRRD